MVQLGNFFIVPHIVSSGLRAGAQQRKQLLHIPDLREDLGFHLGLALKLIRCRILKLLDIIEREDTRLAPK